LRDHFGTSRGVEYLNISRESVYLVSTSGCHEWSYAPVRNRNHKNAAADAASEAYGCSKQLSKGDRIRFHLLLLKLLLMQVRKMKLKKTDVK